MARGYRVEPIDATARLFTGTRLRGRDVPHECGVSLPVRAVRRG